jgi:pimeloyl-ACP methyl ester carboxylesterase
MPTFSRLVLAATLAAQPLNPASALAQPRAPAINAAPVVHHRTAIVNGTEIFYREAGKPGRPVLLLLHGFPSSSHMYRNLMPALADRYHVIAPDYPGFGQSATPDRAKFEYSFANFANLIDGLTTQLGVGRYVLYVQDYGAPVGFRLALKRPDRVSGLIVQNGNAYDEGLSPFWDPIKAYWKEGSDARRQPLRAGLTLAATKGQYVDGIADPTRIDPAAWLQDQALLDRPGIDEIMLDLFYDYRTNVALYPQFQKFFRTRKPPTLIVWGVNDVIFPATGARAYLKDLPEAELHLLDSGHFALEDKGDEIAGMIRSFLARKLPR